MPSLGGTINLGRYEVLLPDDESWQQVMARARELSGLRAATRLDKGKLQVDLTIGPGVKLFAVLAQLLSREVNEARGLMVKRKDCFVLEAGVLRSPFGEVVQ